LIGALLTKFCGEKRRGNKKKEDEGLKIIRVLVGSWKQNK